MHRFAVPVLLAAMAGALLLVSSCGPSAAPVSAPVAHAEIELAVHMGRMQRYHQKWWASARAGNAELAGFYLHELEEVMEEIVDAAIVDDGVDVSRNMRMMGLPAVEALEKLLKEQGVEAMLAQGGLLVNACNNCHTVSGYGFIRIQEPATVVFPDQEFRP